MMSAAASLGMIHLWDVNTGLNSIVNYLSASEDYIKAGALMGIGIVSAGVRSDCNPVAALINEQIESENTPAILKTGAVVGLGVAYAGTADEDTAETLMAYVEDGDAPIDIVGLSCVSLGLIFVGTANFEVATAMVQVLMSRGESTEVTNNCMTRFIGLGLGLLFLGKQEEIEIIKDVVQGLPKPLADQIGITLEGCAYAGTGNVLKVQQFLHMCGEHVERDEDGKEKTEGVDMSHQMNAVLSLALVAMGEDLGNEMALRTCDNLLQYGDTTVKKAVPLALALLSVSNPDMGVTDQLSRLSHDPEADVSQNAILALGLVSAGTNNARIAAILRQLSTFYAKEPNHLFVVQVAQGLCHMGKGLLSLSPAFSDRLLHSTVSLAGILVVLHACTDIKNTLLGNHHYLLYYLSISIKPNMLITIDEEGNPLQATVRVGKAVDTVGQAGKPKTITGFQTHTTPVLIGHGERAELSTDEYIPVSDTLEGIIILKVNPDSVDAKLKEEAAKDSPRFKGGGGGHRADLTW
jgi:26S proteasome regulatory subunit N1